MSEGVVGVVVVPLARLQVITGNEPLRVVVIIFMVRITDYGFISL
jgi:hypothetical protein